ncbi:MAG TPA: hypothetical protein VGN51_22240 [Acidimicrobiia bacterium]|jgi:hypothetical protein
MQGDEVSIDFSVEELLLLAELLGQPALPGLDDAALAHLTPDARSAASDAALHSLMARRVVVSTAEGVTEVAAPVMSLLEVASAPALLGRAEHEVDGLMEIRFYLSQPDVSVEQTPLIGGVHRLTPFATEELLTRALGRCALTERPVVDADPITVTLGQLRATNDAVEAGEVDQARAALGGSDGAAAFVAALTTRVSSSRVTFLHRPTDTVIEGGELTWLDGGPGGLWLTPTVDTDPDEDDLDAVLDFEVEIAPATAAAIAAELHSYLPGSD